MAEVDRHHLQFWLEKITNDPDLLAEDVYGKKIHIGDLTKKPYRTFCNIQVNRICNALKYDGFDDMTANEIHEKCKSNWLEVEALGAFKAAMLGDLVIAVLENKSGHGHCSVIYPKGPMIYSGKWKMDVPWTASVDRVVPCGVNFAFAAKPDYFRLNLVTI